MTFVSYAQNFEDVLLWRAFRSIERGQYIDIGAHDPVVDSVSHAFFLAGWRGIHAEPIAQVASRLKDARPGDIVLAAAISNKEGPIPLFELGGLSSNRADIAKRHQEQGHEPYRTAVPTIRLDKVLQMAGDVVHWLKIDVEGMEQDVLKSWRGSPVRPWVLVIESTLPNSEEQTQHLWIDEVLKRGYRETLFDGLSRYFVHEAHPELVERLNRPANVFDGFQVTTAHYAAKSIAETTRREAEEAAIRERSISAELAEAKRRLHDLDEQLRNAQPDGQDVAKLRADLADLSAQAMILRGTVQTTNVLLDKVRDERDRQRTLREESQSELQRIAALLDADGGEGAPLSIGQVYSAVQARLSNLKERIGAAERRTAEQVEAAERRAAEQVEAAERNAAEQAQAAEQTKVAAQLQAVERDKAAELHAAQQYRAGAESRTSEILSLSDRLNKLQAEHAELQARFARAEAAAQLVAQLYAAASGHLSTIYASTRGAFAARLGLIPLAWAPDEAPALNSAGPADFVDTEPAAAELPAARTSISSQRTEMAVNNIRHVNQLLVLNGSVFIDTLYRTFLKRSPDREGRDHFVDRLQAGHGKNAVLLAIANSPEARAIGAPVEGVAELAADENQLKRWSKGRDRVLERRLNRLEYVTGEAHGALLDRLDDVHAMIEQIQIALMSNAAMRVTPGQQVDKKPRPAPKSIKKSVSVPKPSSAKEFVGSLKSEIQSSAEAQSFQRR